MHDENLQSSTEKSKLKLPVDLDQKYRLHLLLQIIPQCLPKMLTTSLTCLDTIRIRFVLQICRLRNPRKTIMKSKFNPADSSQHML